MSSKSFSIFVLLALAVAASADHQLVGGATEADAEKAQEITELLKNNLHKLEGEALVK